MATTESRTGFRLPWATDRAASREASADPADAPAAPAPATDVITQLDEAPEAGADMGVAATGDAAGPEEGSVSISAPDMALHVRPATSPATEPEAPGSAPPSAEATAAAPARRPTKFLADLTRAMQTAAEQARTATLEQYRADGAAVMDEIHARSGSGADDLRRRADDDVAAIKDWSKAEIARIREETETRVRSRREQLEGQLERHAALVEHEVEKVRGRIAAFEAEMGRFFDELLREEDPAVFAARAASLPEPPPFDGVDDDALVALMREPGIGLPAPEPQVAEAEPVAEAADAGPVAEAVEAVEPEAVVEAVAGVAEAEADAQAEADAPAGTDATWAGWGAPFATPPEPPAVEEPTDAGDDLAEASGAPFDREAAMAAIEAAAEAAASFEAAEAQAERAEAAADRAEAVAGTVENAWWVGPDAEPAAQAPEPEPAAQAPEPAPEPAAQAPEPAPEPAAQAPEPEPEIEIDPRLAMLGLTPDFAAAETAAAEAAAADVQDVPEIGADILEARLAGLAGEDDAPPAQVVTTQLVVTGLVSVASIASFKRHVGRLPGVGHVGVSSGPDGEFVFTVQHEATTSLRDLVPTLPGFAARVVGSAEGIVQVSAQDPQD